MKAVEMFAGIGGFRIGLEKAGFQLIWANDIDVKACAVYRTHFGDDSIICGDIREEKKSIPKHDLLTAGFPCQPFSAAGKKLGVHDRVRGTLFAEIVEVLERVQPAYFILENVKRLLTMEQGEHFRTILLALTAADYFVEWRLLNAKNFGLAQNRERVFIVGRKNGKQLCFCDPGKFESEHSVLFLGRELKATHSLFGPSTISDLLEPISPSRKLGIAGIAYRDKALAFSPDLFQDQAPPRLLGDVLQEESDMRFDFTDVTNGWLKNNTDVNSFIHGVEILSNQEGGRRMGYTIFGIGGLAPTLTATASRHYERYRVGQRYRRLTNVEYARLQGFPDDWCNVATIYDQYALYGNAVPPVMVNWVGNRLLERSMSSGDGRRNGRRKAATASTRP
jgi:DNA (cytosine-5)-methyltransferase 1